MTTETIQPGDRVELKSGGPEMTVAKAVSGGQFFCQWFDKGEVKGSTFAAHMLKKVG